MATCLDICPRTNAYFRFATRAEKGPRQGELFSTKTSNIESIEFQTKITLLFLFIMKDHYMLSI